MELIVPRISRFFGTTCKRGSLHRLSAMCSNFRVEVDLNAPISRRSSAVTESRGLYPRDTLLTKKFEEEL